MLEVSLFNQIKDRGQSSIYATVKLPSLLDTFGSQIGFGGNATVFGCHGELPFQVAPPISETKRALGKLPRPKMPRPASEQPTPHHEISEILTVR